MIVSVIHLINMMILVRGMSRVDTMNGLNDKEQDKAQEQTQSPTSHDLKHQLIGMEEAFTIFKKNDFFNHDAFHAIAKAIKSKKEAIKSAEKEEAKQRQADILNDMQRDIDKHEAHIKRMKKERDNIKRAFLVIA